MRNVAIVSLSSGIIGEASVAHEVRIGEKRLREYGLEVRYMPNALKGMAYVQAHPEARAADFLSALSDDSIDMIFCAIGGEDTYRLLPYLFGNGELQRAVRPKIFLGFSDTTINHLMLRKVGLNTFYGQAFFTDTCELAEEMLPYTKHYFEELLQTGTISEIRPSDIWYESRKDFSVNAIGTQTKSYPNEGFLSLQGSPVCTGEILGGCLDTLYDIFDNTRFADTVEVYRKYGLFPSLDDWKGKILLIETSEELATPEKFRRMVMALKNTGMFRVINGILVGKPVDELYDAEYREILMQTVDDPSLPIIWNINVGHALPRCIIPFGVPAIVDVTKQIITFQKRL